MQPISSNKSQASNNHETFEQSVKSVCQLISAFLPLSAIPQLSYSFRSQSKIRHFKVGTVRPTDM